MAFSKDLPHPVALFCLGHYHFCQRSFDVRCIGREDETCAMSYVSGRLVGGRAHGQVRGQKQGDAKL